MYYDFSVGRREKHKIEYHFNPMWGTYRIILDGKKYLNGFFFFVYPIPKTVEFTVGEREIHKIRIEKRHRSMFRTHNDQNYKFFVDDKLIKEINGM